MRFSRFCLLNSFSYVALHKTFFISFMLLVDADILFINLNVLLGNA